MNAISQELWIFNETQMHEENVKSGCHENCFINHISTRSRGEWKTGSSWGEVKAIIGPLDFIKCGFQVELFGLFHS